MASTPHAPSARPFDRRQGPEQIADALLASAVGGTSAPARKRARFHALRVAEVRPLTDAAVEVTFEIPERLQGEFDYLAGQHVALRAHLDGHEVRRSYSLCRPPRARLDQRGHQARPGRPVLDLGAERARARVTRST